MVDKRLDTIKYIYYNISIYHINVFLCTMLIVTLYLVSQNKLNGAFIMLIIYIAS